MLKNILATATLLFAIALASAANVTGNWNGHMVLDGPPKMADPSQQKMANQMAAMLKQLKVTLTLRPNKTFALNVEAPKGNGFKGRTVEGTWKQDANNVTITPTKEDGKPKASPPESIAISKDGNTLTLDPTKKGAKGPKGKIVFTRSK